MTPERNNNSEHTQQSPDNGSSNQGSRRSATHVDLEHASPTDSRADEKVIVNYRVEHAPSFRDSDRENNNEEVNNV